MQVEVVVWSWEVLSPWLMRHGSPRASSPHANFKGQGWGDHSSRSEVSKLFSVKDYIIYIFGFGCNIIYVAITHSAIIALKPPKTILEQTGMTRYGSEVVVCQPLVGRIPR